jgi:hypothetical protein
MTNLIFEKLSAVMKDINPIAKNRKNVGQNYPFRGIDDVMNELNQALIKHGIIIIPSVKESQREERKSKSGNILIWTILTVEYTFFANDGSNINCIIKSEGMDSGDKGINKALSAAFKYACLQVFCIPTEEKKDSEYDSPEIIEEKNINFSSSQTNQEKWKKEIFLLSSDLAKKLSVKQLDYFNLITTKEYNYPEADYKRDLENLRKIKMKNMKPEIEENEKIPEFDNDFNEEKDELPIGVL